MGNLKIGKYYGEDKTKKTYLFSENLEEGYKDITSIEMIISSSDFCNKDWLFTKNFLIDYTNTLDLDKITKKEKHLLCQYGILSYDYMVDFYDKDKVDVLLNDLEEKSNLVLEERKEKVLKIYENLEQSEKENLENALNKGEYTWGDDIYYLSDEEKITITNILSGDSQKGYSDDIYKIK